ncbi:hypothetical protein O3M35_012674 [Rhynocoris fuscipes]|uniref:Uncharacterized protein n=1 Tax=Rhynocoris fuscipes TaxID=488301 RepID=A0AAW1CT75_9HEMI
MFRKLFFGLTLIGFVMSQLTPNDKIKIRQTLKQLEIKLQRVHLKLDDVINEMVMESLEKARLTGNFKAYRCSEKAAFDLIKTVYKVHYLNTIYLSNLFQEIINKIEDDTMSESEQEDIKSGIDRGDYDELVKEKIQLTEEYDLMKSDDFHLAVSKCLQIRFNK